MSSRVAIIFILENLDNLRSVPGGNLTYEESNASNKEYLSLPFSVVRVLGGYEVSDLAVIVGDPRHASVDIGLVELGHLFHQLVELDAARPLLLDEERARVPHRGDQDRDGRVPRAHLQPLVSLSRGRGRAEEGPHLLRLFRLEEEGLPVLDLRPRLPLLQRRLDLGVEDRALREPLVHHPLGHGHLLAGAAEADRLAAICEEWEYHENNSRSLSTLE